MKRIKLTLLMMSLLLTLSAFAGCSDDNDPTTPAAQDLETSLENLLNDSIGPNIPGVSVHVMGEGIDFQMSTGSADLQTGEELTENHLFHGASIGKSFMGVAFTQLIMAGAVDPHSTLLDYFPPELANLIPQADEITVRDLLQHTSGIVDVLNEVPATLEALEANPTRIWTNEDLVEFALGAPLNFSPGDAFSYSNTNYMILALILEMVTEKNHHQALQDLVFSPLGMTQTFTSNDPALMGPLATGHLIFGEQYDDAMELVTRWEAGSGGQWTTPADLTRFIRGVIDTNALLDDAGRQAMLAGSQHGPYGFGLSMVDTPHGNVVTHDGLLLGFASYMTYFTDANISVTMTINGVAYDSQSRMYAEKLFMDFVETLFE